MKKFYKYELVINGVVRKTKSNKYNTNIIKEVAEDIKLIGRNVDSFEIRVNRKPYVEFQE